jgi:hypothetical protein
MMQVIRFARVALAVLFGGAVGLMPSLTTQATGERMAKRQEQSQDPNAGARAWLLRALRARLGEEPWSVDVRWGEHGPESTSTPGIARLPWYQRMLLLMKAAEVLGLDANDVKHLATMLEGNDPDREPRRSERKTVIAQLLASLTQGVEQSKSARDLAKLFLLGLMEDDDSPRAVVCDIPGYAALEGERLQAMWSDIDARIEAAMRESRRLNGPEDVAERALRAALRTIGYPEEKTRSALRTDTT